MSDQEIIHTREAYTILEMIGDVGGFFDGLVLIVAILISNIISHNMFIEISSNMYQVKSKDVKLARFRSSEKDVTKGNLKP